MISVCEPSAHNPLSLPDPSTMSDEQPTSPIHADSQDNKTKDTPNNINSDNNIVRRERPTRACKARSAARLHEAAAAEAAIVAAERKQKRKERPPAPAPEDESPPPSPQQDPECSKIVTPLVGEPPLSQLPRWNIRSMCELASVLNFLNVFRPLLNIKAEFSVEELETALITPNNTLADIHIPLLKAIPPVTRMALGQNTWVTVLCRKLRDWWHWVADGELPIVASHGAEIEAYNTLDPGVRVVILKALCDIRVEQEDIRNYIDDSIKHGVHVSAFRKERIGGDSHGISYWYEDDPVIGQRLYREIRKVEVKKGKGKSVQPIPSSCYQWETVATSLDEFEDVSEKLFSSKNRTEASVGKKLKIDMLPEVEKVHKKREKLLKKQHRQALLLDNMMSVDGLAPGRSLRGRKPVSYTFDDYDRSISEAIKITKNQPSLEPTVRREGLRPDTSTNGRLAGPSQTPQNVTFSMPSPSSLDYDESDEDHNTSEPLDRSNRRRQRPQRYSAKEFVEAVSDNEGDFDSDDDIVGEVVYDEEYLRKRKGMKRMSSSSEGDEEYHWEGENAEEEEEEEEEDYADSLSSDDSGQPKKFKKLPGRTRRETKLRSVREIQSGLRRSKRATRTRIDYKQLDGSDSENESLKAGNSSASDKHTDAEFALGSGSEDSERNDNNEEMKIEPPGEEEKPEAVEKEQIQLPKKADGLGPGPGPGPEQDDEVEGGVQKRRFLDLNELAPGSGFEDGPNSVMKDEDIQNF